MFYYSEKKCKTWANIFMENNVKQITSNFLLETTCVNYKPNSSTQWRLTRSDTAQLDLLAKLLIILLVNNCKLLLAFIRKGLDTLRCRQKAFSLQLLTQLLLPLSSQKTNIHYQESQAGFLQPASRPCITGDQVSNWTTKEVQVKWAQNIKTPWQKLLVENAHKEIVNGAITAFIEKSVENKIHT